MRTPDSCIVLRRSFELEPMFKLLILFLKLLHNLECFFVRIICVYRMYVENN